MGSKARRIHFGRWAIFGIMVAILITTLFCLIWTGENGKALYVWLPDSHGNSRHLFVASFLGHLDGGIKAVSPPPGWSSRPSKLIEIHNYRNLGMIDHGMSYMVILGLESVVLFFLVPSVLSGGKE